MRFYPSLDEREHPPPAPVDLPVDPPLLACVVAFGLRAGLGGGHRVVERMRRQVARVRRCSRGRPSPRGHAASDAGRSPSGVGIAAGRIERRRLIGGVRVAARSGARRPARRRAGDGARSRPSRLRRQGRPHRRGGDRRPHRASPSGGRGSCRRAARAPRARRGARPRGARELGGLEPLFPGRHGRLAQVAGLSTESLFGVEARLHRPRLRARSSSAPKRLVAHEAGAALSPRMPHVREEPVAAALEARRRGGGAQLRRVRDLPPGGRGQGDAWTHAGDDAQRSRRFREGQRGPREGRPSSSRCGSRRKRREATRATSSVQCGTRSSSACRRGSPCPWSTSSE